MASRFKQEMPPSGGYGPIEWARKIPKGVSVSPDAGAEFGLRFDYNLVNERLTGVFNSINEAEYGFPNNHLAGYAFFGGLATVTGIGWALFAVERRYKRKLELEMRDGRIAVEPFIVAEKHRMFLKQLRDNREEENELMKNVPGWETGKWQGEPVYHNKAGRFPQVHPEEYYAHNRWAEMYDRVFEKRKH